MLANLTAFLSDLNSQLHSSSNRLLIALIQLQLYQFIMNSYRIVWRMQFRNYRIYKTQWFDRLLQPIINRSCCYSFPFGRLRTLSDRNITPDTWLRAYAGLSNFALCYNTGWQMISIQMLFKLYSKRSMKMEIEM